MKPLQTAAIAGLLLFVTACQKTDMRQSLNVNPQQDTPTIPGPKSGTGHHVTLKSFSLGSSRVYQFYYSPNGHVDSIVVTGSSPYTYKVSYNHNRLDSVSLVQNGKVVSTNKNFTYKGNLITGYDYFLYAVYQAYPQHEYITYDQKKRIESIQSSPTFYQQFSYDKYNNIISWYLSGDPYGTTFTFAYDAYQNPLYRVPDLFALLVEESVYWELILSEHNSISKAYPDGSVATYTNNYNEEGLLISKTVNDPHSGTTTYYFTYQ